MNIEAFRQINGRLSDFPELFFVESSLSRVIAHLRKLHALPFVRHTAATAVLRVHCVLQFWDKSKAFLILLLKVLLNLLSKSSRVSLTDETLCNHRCLE